MAYYKLKKSPFLGATGDLLGKERSGVLSNTAPAGVLEAAGMLSDNYFAPYLSPIEANISVGTRFSIDVLVQTGVAGDVTATRVEAAQLTDGLIGVTPTSGIISLPEVSEDTTTEVALDNSGSFTEEQEAIPEDSVNEEQQPANTPILPIENLVEYLFGDLDDISTYQHKLEGTVV